MLVDYSKSVSESPPQVLHPTCGKKIKIKPESHPRKPPGPITFPVGTYFNILLNLGIKITARAILNNSLGIKGSNPA